jgi:hypothetical protein
VVKIEPAASSFSEKSVHLAVGQMRAMLQIAAEELQKKPIIKRPAKISASGSGTVSRSHHWCRELIRLSIRNRRVF